MKEAKQEDSRALCSCVRVLCAGEMVPPNCVPISGTRTETTTNLHVSMVCCHLCRGTGYAWADARETCTCVRKRYDLIGNDQAPNYVDVGNFGRDCALKSCGTCGGRGWVPKKGAEPESAIIGAVKMLTEIMGYIHLGGLKVQHVTYDGLDPVALYLLPTGHAYPRAIRVEMDGTTYDTVESLRRQRSILEDQVKDLQEQKCSLESQIGKHEGRIRELTQTVETKLPELTPKDVGPRELAIDSYYDE